MLLNGSIGECSPCAGLRNGDSGVGGVSVKFASLQFVVLSALYKEETQQLLYCLHYLREYINFNLCSNVDSRVFV